MAKKKVNKVKVGGVKPGTVVKYRGNLWIRDNCDCIVSFKSGKVAGTDGKNLMVTPIKIQIKEIN